MFSPDISLHPHETLRMVLRKHPIVYVFLCVLVLIFLIILGLYVTFRGVITVSLNEGIYWLLFGIFWMIGVTALYVRYIEIALDVIMITSERIVTIDQRSFFSREITETPLRSIQSITARIDGFLSTTLEYGNLEIKSTNPGADLLISHVPRVIEVGKEMNLIIEGERKDKSVYIRNPGDSADSRI